MAQSDSQLGRSPDAPVDPPTVLDQDLYGSSEADIRRTSSNGESDSGTKTVLHQAELNDANGGPPAELDLEDQKTVISRRPPVSTTASPRELAALLQGQQLGDYVLDEFVGGGGMGAVFRGTDLELGRTVAVKVLSRDQGADPETLRRFKNEAQSAARLDHDNIARVFFVGEQDGWNFIVFEFIEGVNIRDLVERRGPLPLDISIEYVVQVAEALEHAAERDVVHRDIKPSNVLITPGGRAKLVDMGLARLHHMEAGHSDLTASGVTLGTFDYISPEQASDPRQADVRSDLYSLGCTLFFMLTGRAPFPHGTVLQKLLAHSGEAPPDPCEQRPDLPPEMTKIIFRLLAKRPAQRYQQPREFINELLVLRDRLGFGGTAGALLSPQFDRLTWRERLLTIGAPIAVLLLVFFGLHSYWSRSATNAQHAPGFHAPLIDDRNDAATFENETSSHDPAPGNEINNALPADRTDSSPSGNSSEAIESSSASGADDGDSASRDAGDGSATTLPPAESVAPEATAPADPTPNDGVSRDAVAVASADGASEIEVPPMVPVVRKIVIGDASVLGDLGPSTRIFAKLSAALASEDFQRNLANISEIEIRQRHLREAAPLRIELPPDKHLTIRGDVGGEVPPTLYLTASATEQPARDRGMIEVEGGKLSLDNLHLKMRIDGSVDRAWDISLLRIPAGHERPIEISKCILTIENPPSVLAPSAAFFDFAPLVDPADQLGAEVRINLSDCILRGEATVIRMRQSAPLNFFWNNGLLVTSQRLLLAEGTSHETGDRPIRLSLLHVTAKANKGLCLLRDSTERPYQLGLALVCNKSILSAGSSALVQHVAVGEYETYQKSLFIGGASNVYEEVAPFWAIAVENVEQPGMDWGAWREREQMTGGMPSSIEPVGWMRLRSEVSGVATSKRGTRDYLVDPESPGAAAIESGEIAGLKAESLPALPEDAPPPSTTSDDVEALDAT